MSMPANPAIDLSHDGPFLSDPWEAASVDYDKRDSWLLSYIDILTLFLTLFVMLLVLQPKGDGALHDASAINPAPLTQEAPPSEPAESPQAASETALQAEPIKAAPPEPAIVMPDIPLVLINEEPVDEFVHLEFFPEISIEPSPQTAAEVVPKETPEVSPVEPAMAESTELLAELQLTAPAPVVRIPLAPVATSTPLDTLLTLLSGDTLRDLLQVSRTAEGVQLEVSDTILFAPGSADLTGEGRGVLNELASVLAGHQGIISVEGHTDDLPIANTRFPSNWELSSGRATAVARYLIEQGLPAEQLRAIGYADTRPLESNESEAGRAKNRRVSLVVHFPPIEGAQQSSEAAVSSPEIKTTHPAEVPRGPGESPLG